MEHKCCICLSIAERECMSRQERAPDFASCIPACQGGCTETARNSTRLQSESGYRGLRRGCRRCNTRSVRKRPYGVWVLVSLWPSHHETPEEDRSDGGIPERGNNANGIPLSACTAGYRHRPSIPGRQGAGARRYAVKDTAVATVSLRRASVAQQVIHWRGTNVRPRQFGAH